MAACAAPAAPSAHTIAFAPAGGDPRRAYRPAVVATAGSDTTSDERREELAEISGDLGAAIAQALHGQAAPDGISESTQALLDRLERLADLRDRGLLGREEYETAKETIVRELETRQ